MATERIDLPQGTLDLLLKSIVLEPRHGWDISQRIQQMSSDILQVQEGSLYPALHRLERPGWVKGHWEVTRNNRRAKYYMGLGKIERVAEHDNGDNDSGIGHLAERDGNRGRDQQYEDKGIEEQAQEFENCRTALSRSGIIRTKPG